MSGQERARDHQICLGAPYNFNRKGRHQTEAEKQLSLPNMLFYLEEEQKNPGEETRVFMVFKKASESNGALGPCGPCDRKSARSSSCAGRWLLPRH